MSSVRGRVCVRALVLLLEAVQACRWSWFVFALNGCKPLASLVTMTKHVCAHTLMRTHTWDAVLRL